MRLSLRLQRGQNESLTSVQGDCLGAWEPMSRLGSTVCLGKHVCAHVCRCGHACVCPGECPVLLWCSRRSRRRRSKWSLQSSADPGRADWKSSRLAPPHAEMAELLPNRLGFPADLAQGVQACCTCVGVDGVRKEKNLHCCFTHSFLPGFL